MYSEESSQSFDIYQEKWEFADHMMFFFPACARSASTVAIGDSSSESNATRKRARTDIDDDVGLFVVFFAFEESR